MGSNAAQQARYRAKKRAEAAAAAIAAIPADEITERFLTAVVSWSGAQPGAVARSVALDAAAQLDAMTESAEPERIAKLRALAASWGVPGAIVGTEQDAARATALSIVGDTLRAIEAGKTTLPEVRAGLRAAKVLARRRPKLDEGAIETHFARLLSGIGNPPPAELVGTDDEESEDEE